MQPLGKPSPTSDWFPHKYTHYRCAWPIPEAVKGQEQTRQQLSDSLTNCVLCSLILLSVKDPGLDFSARRGCLGGQNPALGAPVIGREKVRLGLDAVLEEDLADQVADGGRVAARKR